MDNDDLAPWDTIQFFKIPTEKTITLGASAIQVCSANPNRVALIFSTPGGGGTVILSINPNFDSNSGMTKNSGMDPLILTHRDVGPLVQMPWFASSGALGNLTVTEVILNRWPDLKSIVDGQQRTTT